MILPFLLAVSCLAAPTIDDRINVVLITLDAARADRFGAYGSTRGATPAVDALAAAGAVFEQARAHASWTVPSLSSLMSSRYPESHGASGQNPRLDPTFETVGSRLKAAGWRTAAFTSGAARLPDIGWSAPFEHAEPAPFAQGKDRSFRWLADRALAWIGDGGSGPFFVWIHALETHLPLSCPRKSLTRYVTTVPDGALEFDAALEERPLKRLIHILEVFNARVPDTAAPLKARDPLFSPAFDRLHADPDSRAWFEARYDGCLNYADAELGRLKRLLERKVPPGRTLWILSSDHGEYLGHAAWHDSPAIGHPMADLHDELLRVPLILSGPGVSPRRIADPVGHIDVAPTVLELLGLPPSPSFQGRSLVRGLRGEPLERRPFVAADLMTGFGWRRAIVAGGWKLLWGGGRFALFDLGADPGERRDLSLSAPLKLLELAAAYLEERARAGER